MNMPYMPGGPPQGPPQTYGPQGMPGPQGYGPPQGPPPGPFGAPPYPYGGPPPGYGPPVGQPPGYVPGVGQTYGPGMPGPQIYGPQGYGPPQGQPGQQQRREQITVPGVPKGARPSWSGSSELRDKYRKAPREAGPGFAGKWPGVCTYAALVREEDQTTRLQMAFGVDTPSGPRSWMWSCNVDKVPGLFWEAVEVMLGDFEGDVKESYFVGKWAMVVVAPGVGKYEHDYRPRRLERYQQGMTYQPLTQGMPANGRAPQAGQQAMFPQGQQQGYPQQGQQQFYPQQGQQQFYGQHQGPWQGGQPMVQGYVSPQGTFTGHLQSHPQQQPQQQGQQSHPQHPQQPSMAQVMGVPESDLPF